jgi:charged multivesicular body protein 4
MSVFGKLFGGKKQPVAPTPQEALQKLQETEDLLIKKQEYLEKKISTVGRLYFYFLGLILK